MHSVRIKIPKFQVPDEKTKESSIIKDILPEIEYYQFEEFSSEEIEPAELDTQSYFGNFSEEPQSKKKQGTKIPKKKVERPAFATYYTIRNFNKLIELDLSKISKVETTVDDLQQQIQSAYNKGYEDGQQVTQMALAEEFHKYEEWMKRIDSVIENLEIEFARKLKDLKEILVPLAIKTAEHILRAEIHIDPKVVERQIEKALEIIDNEKVFKIRLNPADIEILKMLNSKFILDPKLKEVKIIQDPNVEKGGCILETEVGRIDARIQSQLAKIEASLKNYPFSFGSQDV